MPNPNSATKAIRAYCLECSGGSATEVRRCPITSCPLWPWRFGVRPKTAKRRGDLPEGQKRECTC